MNRFEHFVSVESSWNKVKSPTSLHCFHFRGGICLGRLALWSSSRLPCNLWIREKKSSSGTVGACGRGRTSPWLLGNDDLCSSIREPWHFIKVSKKESSGNCSPLFFEAAADNCCSTSDCLLCISPGKKGTFELAAGLDAAWGCCWLWWWGCPWLVLIISRRSPFCRGLDLKNNTILIN